MFRQSLKVQGRWSWNVWGQARTGFVRFFNLFGEWRIEYSDRYRENIVIIFSILISIHRTITQQGKAAGSTSHTNIIWSCNTFESEFVLVFLMRPSVDGIAEWRRVSPYCATLLPHNQIYLDRDWETLSRITDVISHGESNQPTHTYILSSRSPL